MYSFKKLNSTDGFDFKDLNNARQNNYAWSMAELDEYIYVGTGRNIPILAIQGLFPGAVIPDILRPEVQDNRAEIWRYKKDGSLPWQRVYKADASSQITGFRYMIKDEPAGAAPCLYAATAGRQVKVLKSYNGVDWFIMPYDTLEGNSSRYMVILKGQLYLAVVNDQSTNQVPYLYRSRDPEFFPWENVTDTTAPSFDPDRNPQGAIYNMAVFNNRLYVSTSLSSGVQVWRSNHKVPEMNDWTLVVNNGFGDAANEISLSIGVFNDYLYVSGTKTLPLSWALPYGFDMIRIDKNDRWQLVVGGCPLKPADTVNGRRGKSLSGYESGFNNPFNVYAWQIQEYNNKLFVSTFDDSSNMEVILNLILANKAYFINNIGEEDTELLISIYQSIVCLLSRYNYPFGFDLYVSSNGTQFNPIFNDGLGDRDNYGGRMLFVGCDDSLYIGTANPFEGCQVWKNTENCNQCRNNLNLLIRNRQTAEDALQLQEKLSYYFGLLSEILPRIIGLLPNNIRR